VDLRVFNQQGNPLYDGRNIWGATRGSTLSHYKVFCKATWGGLLATLWERLYSVYESTYVGGEILTREANASLKVIPPTKQGGTWHPTTQHISSQSGTITSGRTYPEEEENCGSKVRARTNVVGGRQAHEGRQ